MYGYPDSDHIWMDPVMTQTEVEIEVQLVVSGPSGQLGLSQPRALLASPRTRGESNGLRRQSRNRLLRLGEGEGFSPAGIGPHAVLGQ